MSIKLICFDIDGTIYDEGYISDKTKETFKFLKDSELILFPNTGRTVHSVERIMKELGLEPSKYEAGITTGALIQKLVSREIVYGNFLSLEDYEFLKQFLNDDLILSVYGTDYLYYTELSEELIKDAKALETPLIKIEKGVKVENIVRINFMGKKEKLDEFEEKVLDQFKNKYYHVRNNPISLEILNKNSSKRTALNYIMKKYNLRYDEVLTIGDGNNDITMFEGIKYSVAMGNATDKVKSKANYITKSIQEDGFNYIINKLIK